MQKQNRYHEDMNKDILCKECNMRLEHLESKGLITTNQRLVMRNPDRVVSGHLLITRDSGDLASLSAFRIQDSLARGPGKGGIRFHPEVTAQEVSSLAFVMSLKTALLDIPYGGAKGGVQFNPRDYSEEEIEKVARAYVRRFSDVLGPHKDIPAPDVNTTPQIMNWMRDEYEHITGAPAPGFITGKSVEQGGSEGRVEATGMGAFMILQEKFKDTEKSEMSVAIQGFGNAGSVLASLLHKEGYTVVAVSDSKGGIFNKDGLDIERIVKYKEDGNRISDFEDVEKITNEELLELDVDILAPAALGDVITEENVKNIKAGSIIEVANGPISPRADEELYKKGVEVIPDLLANAGGVTVSYFEWYQNIHEEQWTEKDVFEKLEKKMSAAYKETKSLAQEKNISLRDAAYKIAIDRITEKS